MQGVTAAAILLAGALGMGPTTAAAGPRAPRAGWTPTKDVVVYLLAPDFKPPGHAASMHIPERPGFPIHLLGEPKDYLIYVASALSAGIVGLVPHDIPKLAAVRVDVRHRVAKAALVRLTEQGKVSSKPG